MPAMLLTTRQAAELLNISPSWLEHARLRREGPDSVKVGGKVLYRPTALEAWLTRLEEDQAQKHRGRKRRHLACL